jgi:hypothetical protein
MPSIERVGSYRATAEICGTTHRTVKRSVLASQASEQGISPAPPHNYDPVRDVVAQRVERTKGPNLGQAPAAGRPGRRLPGLGPERRPGVWAPGDMVVFDWGEIGPLYVFCAVAAWSRVRFVYFADNLGADATMTGLARCFEYLGACPRPP